MNLTDYMRLLIRRGWILMLAALLTAGSAFVFSKTQTIVYRATQAILLKPARNDFGLQQTMRQLMASYGARLNAEDRAQEVIDVLKLDMTPSQLNSYVTASPDLNTLVINVDVDMSDPIVAVNVARTYGLQFIQWRDQENAPLRNEDRIEAELIDAPKAGLYRPNTSVNVAAGAVLGLLLGGIIVFILEYLDSNLIRQQADVERVLGLPVLGSLPTTE